MQRTMDNGHRRVRVFLIKTGLVAPAGKTVNWLEAANGGKIYTTNGFKFIISRF